MYNLEVEKGLIKIHHEIMEIHTKHTKTNKGSYIYSNVSNSQIYNGPVSCFDTGIHYIRAAYCLCRPILLYFYLSLLERSTKPVVRAHHAVFSKTDTRTGYLHDIKYINSYIYITFTLYK